MADTDSTPVKKLPELIGYLTFVSFPTVGVVGGMLLVNELARPVSFHCTAPVPASRVQEILYGSTHRVSLYSDQIGKALFDHAKASHRLGLLITDEPDAMELRSQMNVPLALLRAEQDDALPNVANAERIAADETDTEEETTMSTDWSLELGGYSFTNAPKHSEDSEPIRKKLMHIVGNWDLCEPFQRIRDAIQEAQRAAA